MEGICYGDCFDRKTGIRIPAGRSHIHIGNDIKLVDIPKPKPLAEFLAEYINHEYVTGELIGSNKTWSEFLEQALTAYENTENVRINFIKLKEKA